MLLDRLALHLDLADIGMADLDDGPYTPAAVSTARGRLAGVAADRDVIEALCTAAAALGIGSSRAASLALRVARSAAALAGRAAVGEAELALAGRLVLAPRACALPPSMLVLTPGDLVTIPDGSGPDIYRVDRIEDGGHRSLTAVRVEPAVYAAPVFEARVGRPRGFTAPAPVDVTFLDLPLLTGREDPCSPHLAVAAVPEAATAVVPPNAPENVLADESPAEGPELANGAAKGPRRPARKAVGTAG